MFCRSILTYTTNLRAYSRNRNLGDVLVKQIQSEVLNFRHGPVSETIDVNGDDLTLEQLISLGGDKKISISSATIKRLKRSRNAVDKIISVGDPVYGINTGFGVMSNVNIPEQDLLTLQKNLIRSHASGVGEPLPPKLVKRIMALRINTLARGYSGVSLNTFNGLVNLFNSGCTPLVPCQGTVGASGDLAPLAHIALGLIGEGDIWDPATNSYRSAVEVLVDYGLHPVVLNAKDGLSLVNGTQFICGIGSAALENGLICAQVVQPIAACTFVAMQGIVSAMDVRVSACRPHPGQGVVAAVMRHLVPHGTSDPTSCDVQDPYSLRCIPQVHGCVLEMLATLRHQLETEMNSSTDNPLVFTEKLFCPSTHQLLPSVISGGNFHGEYPAKALDTLALYVGEIGRMSTARILLMVNPKYSRGLPTFLAGDAGLDSGFMCWELTACALDAENRTLSMPASAETAMTGAGKEDHVSMGGFASRKALQVVDNVLKILTIELMVALQALHVRKGKNSHFRVPPLVERLFQECIALTPPSSHDRHRAKDFDVLHAFIRDKLATNADFVSSGNKPKS